MRLLLLAALLGTTLLASHKVAAHAPHDPVWALAISPTFSTDQTLFIGQAAEREWRTMDLLISRNGGASWSLSPKGFDNIAPITACAAASAPSSGRLLICSTFGDGVYRSLDDGQSWARANSG
ncbi:MAG: hypothetical protein OER87_12740, partial [Gammaproteobacteria bacterium]|nr:hypothetical protein [Gammaproteobacteria bacterium]